MQVAILCGGFATRLRPLTRSIPKCMLKIRGKPFLQYQIELLRMNQINKIVICGGYKAEQILDYFGDCSEFDVHLEYSIEESQPLGTAGALKKAEGHLEDNFMVMYGDSYLPTDFHSIFNHYKSSGRLGLMTVYRNHHQYDKSNVSVRDGFVTQYNKNAHDPSMVYIDYGLSVLNKKVLWHVERDTFTPLESIFNKLVQSRELIAYIVKKRFHEIGSFAGLSEFRNYASRMKL